MKKVTTLVAGLAVGILALTGCGKEGAPGEQGSGGEAPEYKVAEDVDLADSPTWKKAKDARSRWA